MEESPLFDEEVPFEGADGSNDEVWFADLLFWRPSKLSDEQMQRHFREWDGRWSQQTKEAVNRFEADGLDLNENWALSPPFWSCPACRRSKEEIFRLSKRGIILAKLELHHDHIRDTIWPRARELFGDNWIASAPEGSASVLDHTKNITSRFDRCLLCSECNAADGSVKRKFRQEIDSRFSFTSREIGEFVTGGVGGDRGVDYEKAWNIWLNQKDGFAARIALIDDLLKRLAARQIDNEWRATGGVERALSAFNASSVLLRAFYSDTKDTERSHLLGNFRTEFLARSTQRDSAKISLSDKSAKAIVLPTDEEYIAYVDPVRPKEWLALSENWHCPVCDRVKRQILRKSKKGKWTGGSRSHAEYIEERDSEVIFRRCQLFPNFLNIVFVRGFESIEICSDCSSITTNVSQWDESLRDPYMSIQDRRDCLPEPHPHTQHEIDFEVARNRVIANEPYGSAWAAFQAFNSTVATFSVRFDHWREQGILEEAIRDALAEDIRIFHHVNNTAECSYLVDWLLKQRGLLQGGA